MRIRLISARLMEVPPARNLNRADKAVFEFEHRVKDMKRHNVFAPKSSTIYFYRTEP